VAGLDAARCRSRSGRVVARAGSIGWMEMKADSGRPAATGSIRAA
jgi:hypothetical protein